MNRKFNRFGRGGCFICRVCQRNTRETGGDHVQAELCEQCWELAGIDNHCNDNGVPGGEIKHYHEPEGCCGFAWVSFAGNTAFGRWAKQKGYASKDYPSGLCFWIGDHGQSVDRKEAHARAMARVLAFHGIQCSAGSRLD